MILYETSTRMIDLTYACMGLKLAHASTLLYSATHTIIWDIVSQMLTNQLNDLSNLM